MSANTVVRPAPPAGWDVAWVAFSGHGLHAPFGPGVLAGRSDRLDAAPPHLAGAGATWQGRRGGPARPGPAGAGGPLTRRRAPSPPRTRRAAGRTRR